MAVHQPEEKQGHYCGNSSRAWKHRKGPGISVLSVRRSVSRNIPHDSNDNKNWQRLFMYASAASLAANLMVLWPVLMRWVRVIAMAGMINNYRQGCMITLSVLHDYMGNLLFSRHLLYLLIVLILLSTQSSVFLKAKQYCNSKNNIVDDQCANIIIQLMSLCEDELKQSVLSTAPPIDMPEYRDHHLEDSSESSSIVSILSTTAAGSYNIEAPPASESSSVVRIALSPSTTAAGSYNIETPPATAAAINLPAETPARPAAVIILKKQRSCSSLQLRYDGYNINHGCGMSTNGSSRHNDRRATFVLGPRPRPAYQANSKQGRPFRDYYKSALNRLSSEQFRSRVDTFLLKHRKRMWAEALNDECSQYMLDGNTLAV